MSTHERTVWISLPVQVEFTYNPAEPAETGPEAQYPGCPETIDVDGIYIGEANITAQLTDEACGEIETAVWEVLRAALHRLHLRQPGRAAESGTFIHASQCSGSKASSVHVLHTLSAALSHSAMSTKRAQPRLVCVA